MKKHYFIYTLLFAYSCSAFAVKPTVKHNQPNRHVQVDASSINDEMNENNDDTVEVSKKPTIVESWRKVASLNLRSLNRDDAWNIGKTVTFAGVGCLLYSYFPKGPNGLNDPNIAPNDPFDGNPGQQLQQEARLREFEQQQEDRRIAQRMQEELEEVVQREDAFFRQREVQRQEEAQRQQEEEGRQALTALQEQLQQAEQRRQQREVMQRQREERQNEFAQWQEEYERDLAEAMRQSQQMEDERINNAPVVVIEPIAEVVVIDPVVENQDSEVVIDPAQVVDCTVCFDTKNIAECYTMTCCDTIFCKECLIEQLTAGLDTNNSAEVKCPNQNCLIKIEQPAMKAITINNKAVYNRYLDITFNEYLIAQGAKQCPTVDCPFRFLFEEGRFESIVCSACHERYCNHCLFNHVANVTCEQARRDRDPDIANQANEQWIRDNTRACGECNAPVERNQGCNHMTCRNQNCRYEFCYVCGKQWGNLQTCPYYNHPPVIPNNQRNG